MTISYNTSKWRSILGQQSRFRLILAASPNLLRRRQSRHLLRQMRQLEFELPHLLLSPLPEAMDKVVIEIDQERPSTSEERELRTLADLAVALNRHPQLGYCLRRSLVRCYFLRRAGLPLMVHFGAQLDEDKPDRQLTGHAWLTLDGKPYFEAAENWRGFTVMVSFP